jgi:hypothetical protein
LPKKSLAPVLEEVNEAIASDIVFCNILKRKKLSHLSLSLDFNVPVEKTLARAELMWELIADDYQKECEDIIRGLCDSEGSKSTLQTATKLYISSLVNFGYSKSYILNAADQVFRLSDVRRCTSSLLDRFFKNFDRDEKKKFQILICGRSSYIEFMAEIFGMDTFSTQNEIPNSPILDLPENFGTGSKKKIAVYPSIEASDPFSAAKLAEKMLSVAKSFHYLHPAQAGGTTNKQIFVVDEKKNSATGIEVHRLFQPHQHLRSRADAPISMEGLTEFVFQIKKKNGARGRSRFLRSLNSMTLASNSLDPESRLIAIWSAFEALLPEPPKAEGRGVRITHFVPLIVPCACYDYLWSNFNECFADCVKQFGKKFVDCVYKYSAVNGSKGLASIMLGDDKTAQKAVLKQVSESPLMLNRIGKLHELINSQTEMSKYWGVHEKRVIWQLHRIYRERNQIVHNGAQSPFLEGLVENAYGYYRGVFLGLEAADKRFQVSDPTQALELVSELYNKKKEIFSSIGKNKSLPVEQRKLKLLDIIFADRLC